MGFLHGNIGKLDITGVESGDYMRMLGGAEEEELVSQILFVRKLVLYFHSVF